jgi:hypothetical protein
MVQENRELSGASIYRVCLHHRGAVRPIGIGS